MKRTDSASLPCPVTPLGVTLLYAGFTSLWIALSDRLLDQLPLAPEQLLSLSTLKGMLFVTITSLLLFLLLRVWREPMLTAASPTTTRPRRNGCQLLLIRDWTSSQVSASPGATPGTSVSSRSTRITSYNVCYTKLLRGW